MGYYDQEVHVAIFGGNSIRVGSEKDHRGRTELPDDLIDEPLNVGAADHAMDSNQTTRGLKRRAVEDSGTRKNALWSGDTLRT